MFCTCHKHSSALIIPSDPVLPSTSGILINQPSCTFINPNVLSSTLVYSR